MSRASRPLVDWGVAERIGTRLASRSPLAGELAELQDDMAARAVLAERLVTEETGLVPAGPARIRVVDRPDWVIANVESFQRLLAPLVDRWEAKAGDGAGVGRQLTAKVAGAELGTLLGWMSGRVLGQYDLLLAEGDGRRSGPVSSPASSPVSGPVSSPGQSLGSGDGDTVYLVGPNLLRLERHFGFPSTEFRLWVLLHELTHRAQFTGVPWLAQHFRSLVGQALSLADPDAKQLAHSAKALMRDRAEMRRRLDDGGMLALVASPEQRVVLDQIGGMMALLEGHGDVTMDRAGAGHVPSAKRFSAVLAARRQGGSPPVRLIRKLIGLESKLNQYAQGEVFIAHIERVAGREAVEVCWTSPEHLPSMEEIRAPQRWLERVDLAAAPSRQPG